MGPPRRFLESRKSEDESETFLSYVFTEDRRQKRKREEEIREEKKREENRREGEKTENRKEKKRTQPVYNQISVSVYDRRERGGRRLKTEMRGQTEDNNGRQKLNREV